MADGVQSGSRVGGPETVLKALEGRTKIVLTTHVSADGDGTGCEIALAAFLRANGKEAWIVNPTPYPDSFRFLVPDGSWICDVGSKEASKRCLEADLGIVVDTSEVQRIGRAKPLFDHLPLVIIDHHQLGPQPIVGELFSDSSVSAAGELVYEVIEAAGGPWPKAAVDGLFVALLTDTGGFRFSNAGQSCFETAGSLVAKGARPDLLHEAVYSHFTLRRYRLLQEALSTLEVHEGGSVAWMSVPEKAYKELGGTSEDLEGFVDVPRNLAGVEVALLLRSTSDGKVKVSLRSTGEVDVNAIARSFGGGGHTKASGALLAGPIENATKRVVRASLMALGGP